MDIDPEHKSTYELVGILDKTNTSYDNMVFTDIHSVWEAHSDELHTEGHFGELEEYVTHLETNESEEIEGHHEESEGHHHHKHGEVTSILVRTGSMQKYNEVSMKYNDDRMNTQAINPTRTMRSLMENIDLSRQVAMLLGGIAIVLAFIIIAIMTFLMLESISKDIKILRFIGMSRKLIYQYIYYQTIIQVSLGVIISLFLSRVVLAMANKISSQLGIIIAIDKFYGIELIIVLAVIILCLIPTIIYILRKREGEIN